MSISNEKSRFMFRSDNDIGYATIYDDHKINIITFFNCSDIYAKNCFVIKVKNLED